MFIGCSNDHALGFARLTDGSRRRLVTLPSAVQPLCKCSSSSTRAWVRNGTVGTVQNCPVARRGQIEEGHSGKSDPLRRNREPASRPVSDTVSIHINIAQHSNTPHERRDS